MLGLVLGTAFRFTTLAVQHCVFLYEDSLAAGVLMPFFPCVIQPQRRRKNNTKSNGTNWPRKQPPVIYGDGEVLGAFECGMELGFEDGTGWWQLKHVNYSHRGRFPFSFAIVQMGCNHQLGKFTFWVEQTPCGLDVSEDAGKHKSLEIVILLQRMGMLRFTPSMCKNTT